MDKKTRPTHMLPTRDPPQKKRPTQTESEGLEKKYSWDSNTYITQNRLQNKGHKKRHRRTLHNTQGKNPLRRHIYYKHICTQRKSIQIYKENLRGLQER